MTSPDPPGPIPAGWYPDPSGSAQQRYWDGSRWTEHYAPGGQPDPGGYAGYAPAQTPHAPAQAPHAAARPVGPVPTLWWAVPAFVVVALIGAAGTWVTASFDGGVVRSVGGLDGGDGYFTLFGSLVALALLIGWRQTRTRALTIAAAVMAIVGALIPLIYIIDPSTGGAAVVEPDWGRGWGLWPAFLGSVALAGVTIALARRPRDR